MWNAFLYHTAKIMKDTGMHYSLLHTFSGAWGELVIWTQDCVYNIFLTALWKVTQVHCAQKLVTEGELYKELASRRRSPGHSWCKVRLLALLSLIRALCIKEAVVLF